MRRSATQPSSPTILRRSSGRIRTSSDLLQRPQARGPVSAVRAAWIVQAPAGNSLRGVAGRRARLTPRCASNRSSRGGPSSAAVGLGDKKPRPLPVGAAGDLVEAAESNPRRKPYIPGPTCLAVSLYLVERYPSGRKTFDQLRCILASQPSAHWTRELCERVPRVWMHKHMPVEG